MTAVINKKPCHDCPFRKDITPYSSSSDILNNLRWFANVGINQNPALCHFSVNRSQYGPGIRHDICSHGASFCAGFLTTLGPDHPVAKGMGFVADHGIECFQDPTEYAQNAACEDQSYMGRIFAHYKSQPKNIQARILHFYGPLIEHLIEKESEEIGKELPENVNEN